MKNVISRIETPESLVEIDAIFYIPSYQRPYVWTDESIKSLFDDLLSAWRSKQPHYYVGTILTSLHDSRYELIDGQQRITTLMLLSLVFKRKGINTLLTNFINSRIKNQLRLSFTIREQVQSFLGHKAELEAYKLNSPNDEEIKKNPYLNRLAGCIKTFDGLLNQLQGEGCKVEEFGDFIYQKLHLITNQIPQGTDLNRLFSTMNNSGVQLEQTDILKALLLKKVTTDKVRYNAMWQACENLDDYFERNVRRLFPDTQWQDIEPDTFSRFDSACFVFNKISEQPRIGMTISQIVAQLSNVVHTSKNESVADKNENELYCRSIVSFAQLLLHSLRIHLQQKGRIDFSTRFHSDHLIETFQTLIKAPENEIIEFIEVLWQVRFAFDTWIVKWVEKAEEDDERLEFSSVNKSQSDKLYYFNRSPLTQSNLSMLQAVRHFVSDRNAQYWLTPLLGWLIKQPQKPSNEDVLNRLEHIDNQLSLTKLELKDASFKLLSDDLPPNDCQPVTAIIDYLKGDKGTHFKHYWFQKLEYLLWKQEKNSNDEKFKKYRIISRNSVEHVHPQHEEYDQQLERHHLDGFGNLVLLNPGQNSSYGNQAVDKKKADFDNKPLYDSLKLKNIFELKGNDKWTIELIKKHREAMLKLIEDHYSIQRKFPT